MESESLIFTGLEIPRDYVILKEETEYGRGIKKFSDKS